MYYDHSFPDTELLKAVQKGDDHALTEIYMRYHKSLFELANKMVESPAESMDFVHDVFVSLITKIRQGELSIHTSISSYLHQSLRHKIFNNMEKMRVADKFYNRVRHLHTAQQTQEDRIIQLEKTKDLHHSLEALPPLTREILLLSRVSEKTYEEIALLKSISKMSVRRHVKQALTVLHNKVTAILFFF